MPRSRRTAYTAIALTSAISLFAGACTGTSGNEASDDPNKDVTINFWHGWSAPSEVKAVEENVKAFEAKFPNIKVKITKNINDDKLNQGLRTPSGPDVASSFTTDNVGRFCSTGVLADLKPFLEKSKIDPASTFPKPMADYTEFEGTRCALPLLGDAYGLYYNKDAFEEAGIKAPPKTLTELREVAKKLTKSKGDSYEQLGIMPNFGGYETTFEHYASQYGVKYFDEAGKSTAATDPKVTELFEWQKSMVDALGGFKKLDKFRTGLGDEWGPKHPFHTGQVAMQLDGEWRGKFAADADLGFEVGAAPFPVPDDQVASYGKGYLAGTVIGVSNRSEKKNAAWEFVKYLATDTDAVVSFANAIHNVPSTMEALKSPKLNDDPVYRTFVDIALHPESSHAPGSKNGGAFLLTLQDLGLAVEKGKTKDLQSGLEKTATQIDKDTEQAG